MSGWDWWELGANLLALLGHLYEHGVLGFTVWFVVTFLTSIIQFVLYFAVSRGRLLRSNSDVVRFIFISSLVLGFLFAVLSHFVVDGLLFTPLNKPLELTLPN